MLPRIAARERITAISCQDPQPGNAPWRHLAAVRCGGGTHFANISPPASARERTAAIFWHRHDVREYTASICCHGQAPQEKAEAARSAIYGGVGPNRWKSTRLKSAALSTRGSGLESLACVWASARNTFYASMRLCVRSPVRLCACARRGVSPSRNLIAGNGFESALFRWATMRPFRVLRSSAVSCAEAKCALTFMLGAANVVKGMSWAFARQWEIWQAR